MSLQTIDIQMQSIVVIFFFVELERESNTAAKFCKARVNSGTSAESSNRISWDFSIDRPWKIVEERPLMHAIVEEPLR